VSRYHVTVDGRSYDVDIDDPHARPVSATLAGTTFSVEIEQAGTGSSPGGAGPVTVVTPPAPVASPPPAETAGDADNLTAPIPGVVSSIAVASGQAVARGDELLTLEAMKMLNVIRSPRDGVVEIVHVAQGSRVAQGEPLVTFAPR